MLTVARGGTLRLEATYTDAGGALVDPTNPLIDLIDSSGVQVTTDVAPSRLSVGRYFYDFVTSAGTMLGIWRIHWTGMVDGVESFADETFEVIEAGIISAGSLAVYGTVAELKSAYAIDVADVRDDSRLSLALEAASRLIDRETFKKFWLDPAPTTRRFTPRDYEVEVHPGIGSTDGLVISHGGSTLTAADYALRPDNAITDGKPYHKILLKSGSWTSSSQEDDLPVEVTARFGWPEVPTLVRQACLLQAARYFKRKDAPFGIAGSAESQLRLSKLDPDVEQMLYSFFPVMGVDL